jgi:hypothetical protein
MGDGSALNVKTTTSTVESSATGAKRWKPSVTSMVSLNIYWRRMVLPILLTSKKTLSHNPLNSYQTPKVRTQTSSILKLYHRCSPNHFLPCFNNNPSKTTKRTLILRIPHSNNSSNCRLKSPWLRESVTGCALIVRTSIFPSERCAIDAN